MEGVSEPKPKPGMSFDGDDSGGGSNGLPAIKAAVGRDRWAHRQRMLGPACAATGQKLML